MMIDAVMYGMIPRKNTATFVSAPPEKRSRKPTTRSAVRVLQLLDRAEVDIRHGDVGPEPKDRDDEDREENLVPQVGDPEHVPQAGEPLHRGTTTSVKTGNRSVLTGW